MSPSLPPFGSGPQSASTSLHTISNPVPRVLLIVVLLIVVSLSAIRPLPSCRSHRARPDNSLHRRALAQQTDPYPPSGNGAKGPAGAVAAGQAKQQREGKWAQ